MRFFLCIGVATAIWISTLRFWFQPAARPVVEHQLELWNGNPDLETLRASNPEWDLMARTFAVLAFANRALAEPERRAGYLATIDRILEQTIADVAREGDQYFLLPYGRARPFIDGPSVFVDGELAMMVAARELVERSGRENVWAVRAAAQIERGPAMLAESYPDEVWLFCNALALAAIKLQDVADGRPAHHADLFARWVASAKHLIDPVTGLLPAKTGYLGDVREGPEGSTLWLVAAMLRVVDDDFARDQYARARVQLRGGFAGFGWAREWPDTWRGRDDVDSGPTIPIVGANAGSSGLALVAARAFGDDELATELRRSLEFAGFPIGGHYAAGNQLSDGVIAYAEASGPLWERAR